MYRRAFDLNDQYTIYILVSDNLSRMILLEKVFYCHYDVQRVLKKDGASAAL